MMIPDRYLFTSESVTEGHPDKLADQISDGILDAILIQDPDGRVALETLLATGLVVVAGEVSSSARVDISQIARSIIHAAGYTKTEYGLDSHTCTVLPVIERQSPDIAQGVDLSLEAQTAGSTQDELSNQGAGDQGLVFGYASNETPEYLPLPIVLAHGLTKKLAQVRKDGTIPYLRPDGKSQVTVEYVNGQPVRIDTIVISAQHHPDVDLSSLRTDIVQSVIESVIPSRLLDSKTRYLVNPTGRFVAGGPQTDVGLTGRKIIVDTYGGFTRHGGGALSGKDPSKIDRSGAYAARYVAKNLVAAGFADQIEIQISYAIGVAQPVSLFATSFGTSKFSDSQLTDLVKQTFDLRPAAISRDLDLKRPIYQQTAAYGHLGRRDLDLPWERLDRVLILQQAAGLERVS